MYAEFNSMQRRYIKCTAHINKILANFQDQKPDSSMKQSQRRTNFNQLLPLKRFRLFGKLLLKKNNNDHNFHLLILSYVSYMSYITGNITGVDFSY